VLSVLRIAIVAAVMLSTTLSAQGDSAKSKTAKAAQAEPKAAPDRRGIEQAPAFVKIVSPVPGSPEAKQVQAEKDTHGFKEGLAAWSTFGLALLTLVLAIATGILARFTYRLWKTTGEMVTKADEAATDQFDAMNRQRDVMASQQAAMEAQCAAMERIADGMAVSAEITRRAWVVTNPPVLRLRTAYLVESKGGEPPTVRFGIENTGHSTATVTVAFLSDSVQTGKLPEAGPITPYNKEEDILADVEIKQGFPFEGHYICKGITGANMGPKPTMEAEFAAALMGGPKILGTGNYPKLSFHGSIHYMTESGTPGHTWISAICTPPSRYFEIENG
jgi:hypothetical protein